MLFSLSPNVHGTWRRQKFQRQKGHNVVKVTRKIIWNIYSQVVHLKKNLILRLKGNLNWNDRLPKNQPSWVLCEKRKKQLSQRKIYWELEAAKTIRYHFVRQTDRHWQGWQQLVIRWGEAGFWRMCKLWQEREGNRRSYIKICLLRIHPKEIIGQLFKDSCIRMFTGVKNWKYLLY